MSPTRVSTGSASSDELYLKLTQEFRQLNLNRLKPVGEQCAVKEKSTHSAVVVGEQTVPVRNVIQCHIGEQPTDSIEESEAALSPDQKITRCRCGAKLTDSVLDCTRL